MSIMSAARSLRLCRAGFAVVFLALLTVASNGRWNGSIGGMWAASAQSPAAGPRVLLTSSDFTYLGACKIPFNIGVAETIYGSGLTFKYEPNDSNNATLLYGASAIGAGAARYPIAQLRVCTPTIPSDPMDLNSYPVMPVVRNYERVYARNGTSHRTVVYDGKDTDWNGSAGPDHFGIHYDSTAGRLYWLYTGTYSGGTPSSGYSDTSKSIGYSTLSWSTSTGIANGPWGITRHAHKGIGGGMVDVPPWYAAAYLSGKRLAAGLGGYGSLCAAGGISMGPKLVALESISASENTSVSGTELIGYDACGGSLLAVRPSFEYQSFDGGGTDKWTWTDGIEGAVWIDTGTKHGVLFAAALGMGSMGYVSSDRSVEYMQAYWIIADPMTFAPVTKKRPSDASLTYIARIYPGVDTTRAGYYDSRRKYGAVRSIAASAGGSRMDAATSTVTTTTAHGLADGARVSIIKTSQSEFNDIWNVTVKSATTFGITDPNGGAWRATSATGGDVYRVEGIGGIHHGITYDPVQKRLYVAVDANRQPAYTGAVLVHVYQVN
jgi:hypothetical protein